MQYSFNYILFEIFSLALVCYIAFLYLSTKFLNLRLNTLDFMYVSAYFLILLLRVLFDSIDGYSMIYLFDNFIIYNDFIKLLKGFMVLFLFAYLVLVYNYNLIIRIPIIEYLILIFLCFFSLVMIIA